MKVFSASLGMVNKNQSLGSNNSQMINAPLYTKTLQKDTVSFKGFKPISEHDFNQLRAQLFDIYKHESYAGGFLYDLVELKHARKNPLNMDELKNIKNLLSNQFTENRSLGLSAEEAIAALTEPHYNAINALKENYPTFRKTFKDRAINFLSNDLDWDSIH